MKILRPNNDVTSTRSIEVNVFGSTWLIFGFSPNRLSLGASVDRYQLTVDFLFLWLVIEFKSPISLKVKKKKKKKKKKKGMKNAKGI
jgi:hypothetical protein